MIYIKANYIVSNSLGGGMLFTVNLCKLNISNFINKLGMFWTLDLDDFSGSFCGKVLLDLFF